MALCRCVSIVDICIGKLCFCLLFVFSWRCVEAFFWNKILIYIILRKTVCIYMSWNIRALCHGKIFVCKKSSEWCSQRWLIALPKTAYQVLIPYLWACCSACSAALKYVWNMVECAILVYTNLFSVMKNLSEHVERFSVLIKKHWFFHLTFCYLKSLLVIFLIYGNQPVRKNKFRFTCFILFFTWFALSLQSVKVKQKRTWDKFQDISFCLLLSWQVSALPHRRGNGVKCTR